MPTIKLKSGSYRYGAGRYTPDSEPFEVSDKMAGILNCEIVPTPTLDEAPTPTLDDKRAEALALGIPVKKQWSLAKLDAEIEAAKYGQPDSE